MKHVNNITFKSISKKTLSLFSYKSLALFFFFMGSMQHVQASHAMGADLTYTCMGNNTYEITLTFYRDCNGTTAPANPILNIASATCNYSNSISLVQDGPPVQIETLCSASAANSTCNGGTLQGVEKYIYKGVYTFPQNCTDWIISYALCCRNGATTNSSNTQNYDLYIEALLNNFDVVCNNSPKYIEPPVFYMCTNQAFSYSHGVVDAEGDSLVYSLAPPLDAPGNPVPYQPGFSAAYPISTINGNVNFNTQTGQMALTPSGVQIGILDVLVQEYRDGQLIGSTMRDMQIVVFSCTNDIPLVNTPTNINGAVFDGATFFLCQGNTLSFDLSATDLNSGDSLSIRDNISSVNPNATLTGNGINPLAANFTWETTSADAGYHTIIIRAQDDACPVIGFQTIGYDIIVSGINAEALDTLACPGTAQNIQLNATLFGNLSSQGTYSWTPTIGLSDPSIANPIAIIDQAITYTVNYDDGSCIASDEVEIAASGAVFISPSIANTCGDTVQLQASYVNLSMQIACATSTIACLSNYNTYGIGADATATGPSGTGNEAGSPYLGYYEDGRTQILYRASELQAAGLVEGLINELAINVSNINSSQPYSGFTIRMGCTFETELFDFIPDLEQVYNGAAITPVLGWNNYTFDDPYIWDGISNVLIEICFNNNNWTNYDHVFYSATSYNSVLFRRVDGSVGCDLNSPTSSYNRPNIQLSNCGIPPSAIYSWSPPDGLSNPNISNPLAAPALNTTYTVTATTASCSFTETVQVNVDYDSTFTAAINIIQSPSLGMADGIANVIVTGGIAPYTYEWAGYNSTQDTLTAIAEGMLTVFVTDALGCTVSNSLLIMSPQMLMIDSITSTAVSSPGASDGSAAAYVSGGVPPYMYSWSTTPAQTTQIATNLPSGTYSVLITDSDGNSLPPINITVSGFVAIDNPEPLRVFNIQPNPNSGVFDIDLAGQAYEQLQLTVFNTLGELIFNEYHNFNTGQLNSRVHLNNPAPGIYFIRAGTASQAEYRKILVR